MKKTTFCAAVAAVTAGQAFVAVAQPTQGARLEEIIVTAQRRSENMQEVPIAVTAVTGELATKLNLYNVENLALHTPGFVFNRVASATATPFIRGIGSSATSAGNEPSVATYMDDVYVPTSSGTLNEFLGTESIEILKGPQGTLFGRNATGGVIHIHSRNPSKEPMADVTIGYGNFDTVSGKFYVSGGLTDNISANVAAFYTDQRDGWGKNIVTGNDALTEEAWGVRGKILIEPSDTFSALLTAHYDRGESDKGIGIRLLPGYYGRGGFNHELSGAGFHDSTLSYDGMNTTKFTLLSAKFTKDWDQARFVSITAYTDSDVPFSFDLDAVPANYQNAYSRTIMETWTQEFQLLSPENANTDWILGTFLLKSKAGYNAWYDGTFLPTGVFRETNSWQDTDSYSVFAEITSEIMTNTDLTLGVRYTKDERDLYDSWGRLFGAQQVHSPIFTDDHESTSMTGRVALAYRFNEDVMGYVAYNRGFKSGGFNLAIFQPTTASVQPAVDPEEVDVFTIGLKSEFADGRVRFNTEAFYYDYSNIQVTYVPPTGGSLVINGGESSVRGIDAELTALPMDNLTVSMGLSLLDAEYDDFPSGPTDFPQAPTPPIPIPAGCNFTAYPTANAPSTSRGCDLSGNDMVQAPSYSTNLTLVYTVPLAEMGAFDLSVTWSRRDSYNFVPDNSFYTEQPRVDLINASVTWRSAGDAFDLRLWGSNLTDEEYWSYMAHSGISGSKGSPSAPRTYGITLGYHFR